MADISKITVNSTAYDIKDAVARTGNIETSRLVRPTKLNGVVDNTIIQQIDDLRANRLAFLPADQVIIEKTTDGGATWVDAGVSDGTKLGLFSQTRNSISIPLLNGQKNILCGLRVTFTAMKYNVPSGTAETQKYNYWNSNYVNSTERYNQLREMYFWVSSNSDAIKVKLERATGGKSNNWSVIFDRSDYGMTGWSGNDYISFSQSTFGGGTNQTGNYWNYRLTFFTCGANGSSTLSGTSMTSAQSIAEIRGYGTTWWTAGNKFAASDHMYSWDTAKNVTFPNQVTANGGFSGSGASLTSLNASNISSGTVPEGRLPYSAMSSTEMNAGTATSSRVMTAKNLKDGMNAVLKATNGDVQLYGVHLTGQVPAPTTADNGKVLKIASGVYSLSDDANTDTKNTAGSTDTSSKIFLIGATTQAANPQTYSHDTAYVGTDGCLYSGGTKVLTAHQDISGKVSGPSSATANHIATFSDTTGKVIKDSGYTIATSVPSNAVFTDTVPTYTYDSTNQKLTISY